VNARPRQESLHLCPVCNTRPCICDRLAQESAGDVDGHGTNDEDPRDEDPVARYGDGTPVNDNEAEIAAFTAFVHETGKIPPSLDALRTWYAQQIAEEEADDDARATMNQ
jgi:hypothetical protein